MMETKSVRLRDHRKARGMSIRALVAASGVSSATICHLETGKKKRVKNPTLRRLASGLGVTIGELAWPPLANAHDSARNDA
jgi:transcriptional regulator with XRE-family HTH domain